MNKGWFSLPLTPHALRHALCSMLFLALYWDIGQRISKRQVTGMHGDAVAEQLATDLRMEFPGVGGFSRRNVFYMREFYIAYRDLPKVQPLVAQIGWTQNLIVR